MSIRAVVLFTFVSVGVTLAQNEVCALDSGKSRDVTIKDVMVTAYKEKLAKKVMQGEATQDEKQRLLNLYEALAQSAPPRGSQVSWKRKTEALVNAAQAAVEGHENAPILLKRTMECGACHTSHK